MKPEMRKNGRVEAMPVMKDRKARWKIILGLDLVLYVHEQEKITAKEA